MDIDYLNKFRELLLKSQKSVSELEYTRDNYDNLGNLIKESLPTITTDFCEVGVYNDEIYFVFVVKSKTFNIELFNKLKNKSNVKIYGFVDFNRTLFPVKKFNLDIFMKEVQKDKYLQIQFDFKEIDIFDLFKTYSNLLNVFEKDKVVVVNQLEINLIKRN